MHPPLLPKLVVPPPIRSGGDKPQWVKVFEICIAGGTLSLSALSFNLTARVNEAHRRIDSQKIHDDRNAKVAAQKLDERKAREEQLARDLEVSLKKGASRRDDARFILDYTDALLSPDTRRRALAMQTLNYALQQDVARVMLAVLMQAWPQAEHEYVASLVPPVTRAAERAPTSIEFYSGNRRDRVMAFADLIGDPPRYRDEIEAVFLYADDPAASSVGVWNAVALMLKLPEAILQSMPNALIVLERRAQEELRGDEEGETYLRRYAARLRQLERLSPTR